MSNTAQIAIVMGSKSDWATMQEATQILDELNVAYHVEVVSAHRTPDKLFEFAENAQKNGYKVIIAGAGGAAHALFARLQIFRENQTNMVLDNPDPRT